MTRGRSGGTRRIWRGRDEERARKSGGRLAAAAAMAATAAILLVALLIVVPERTGQLSGIGTVDGGAQTRAPNDSGRPSGQAGSHFPGSSTAPRPAGSVPGSHGSPGSPASATAAAGPISIRVAGSRLVDGRGRTVRLLGYNFSGTEYSCIEGQGIFDTPDGTAPSDQVLRAMVGWAGTTAIRLPLNEQCWLGLGVSPQFGGSAYRSAVAGFVLRLNRLGIVVIIDLHRSAPGSAASMEQEPMPDRDHSPAFWASVATTFRGWGGVAFDLFNEPFPFDEANTARAWTCWRDGGCTLRSANSGQPYAAAGMTDLLARVRGAGARNVVFLGGPYWAESLTQWLKYIPSDPLGQLGASFHAYSFNNYCVTTACYDRDLGPIVARVPLLVGEIGPDLTLSSTGIDESCPASAPRVTGFDATAFGWFDRYGVSYTAWSWNPWNDCWSLVLDWKGTPTPVWGTQFRARLGAHRL